MQEKASTEAAAKKREEDFLHQQTLVAPAMSTARSALSEARGQLKAFTDEGYVINTEEELALATATLAAETKAGMFAPRPSLSRSRAASYREAPKMLPDLFKDPGKIISLANAAKVQAQTAATACKAKVAGCRESGSMRSARAAAFVPRRVADRGEERARHLGTLLPQEYLAGPRGRHRRVPDRQGSRAYTAEGCEVQGRQEGPGSRRGHAQAGRSRRVGCHRA